jgi:hypothetical protein
MIHSKRAVKSTAASSHGERTSLSFFNQIWRTDLAGERGGDVISADARGRLMMSIFTHFLRGLCQQEPEEEPGDASLNRFIWLHKPFGGAPAVVAAAGAVALGYGENKSA